MGRRHQSGKSRVAAPAPASGGASAGTSSQPKSQSQRHTMGAMHTNGNAGGRGLGDRSVSMVAVNPMRGLQAGGSTQVPSSSSVSSAKAAGGQGNSQSQLTPSLPQPTLLDWFMAASVVVLFLVHTTVSEAITKAFVCLPESLPVNGQEGRVLVADVEVMCGDFDVVLPGIIGLLAWTVGIPVLGMSILYRHREDLDDPHLMILYGFLHKGYRGDVWYWEGVVLLRKVALLATTVTARDDPFLSALYGSAVIAASLFLQTLVQPFQSKHLNRAEAMQLSAIFVTQFASILHWHQTQTGGSGTAAVFVMFFVNVLAVLFLIRASLLLRIKETRAAKLKMGRSVGCIDSCLDSAAQAFKRCTLKRAYAGVL